MFDTLNVIYCNLYALIHIPKKYPILENHRINVIGSY